MILVTKKIQLGNFELTRRPYDNMQNVYDVKELSTGRETKFNLDLRGVFNQIREAIETGSLNCSSYSCSNKPYKHYSWDISTASYVRSEG